MNVHGKDIKVGGKLIRIARLAAEKYEFLDDPAPTLDALRRSRGRIDLFSFMGNLTNRSPQFDYACEWDNLAAVPISTFEHWWSRQINGKTRNMVRRAEKAGVEVREVPFDGTLIEGVSAIYNETPTRQGRKFWHYGKDLGAVRAENGTFLDRSVFIGAFLGPTLIGFAKLVIDDSHGQAGLMQILSMIKHRDKAPTNALIAKSIQICADRGIPHLVYANFTYGTKQQDSLADFKQHNGFQRIEVPRYYVPLSLIGRTALRWGFHDGLKNHVPEPVLAGLRKARRLWHGELAFGAKETV
jgi:hypothetical protein